MIRGPSPRTEWGHGLRSRHDSPTLLTSWSLDRVWDICRMNVTNAIKTIASSQIRHNALAGALAACEKG